MSVNSHIQLPKCVLKNFRSSNGRVHYFELETGRIREYSAGLLGTEFGYYSDEMEKYLNKEIETPFSNVISKVNLFINSQNERLVLPAEIETICKKYVTAAMARSKYALDVFMKGSITAQFLDEQTRHDDVVYFSTCNNNGITPALRNQKLILLINRTDQRLVVPRNCIYSVNSQGFNCIVAPISPICALGLVPEEYKGSVINGEECRIAYIDYHDTAVNMNVSALKYEYVLNRSFVASAGRTELLILKKYLEGNKELLEPLRLI